MKDRERERERERESVCVCVCVYVCMCVCVCVCVCALFVFDIYMHLLYNCLSMHSCIETGLHESHSRIVCEQVICVFRENGFDCNTGSKKDASMCMAQSFGLYSLNARLLFLLSHCAKVLRDPVVGCLSQEQEMLGSIPAFPDQLKQWRKTCFSSTKPAMCLAL